MRDGLAGIHILYIDDDPATSRLVQRHLQRSGCTVTLAASGPDGFAQARAARYDAIALDHYMPGQDGLDVLSALRQLPDTPPVIFVTAAEEPRVAVTALKEGAADYVVKDVQGSFLPTLATAIRHAIDQDTLRRAKEDAERQVRESRDRLEKLAAQQAVLLREVNHRVANSLQLISSLIELQARRVAVPEAREMLQSAAERVEAVSLVHRRLYTSNDVQFVEMDQYLAGLVEELRRATDTGELGPRIELTAEPVRVETDKAVPIGLIVNELVTNALKYAYPTGGSGPIRVALKRLHQGTLRLIVEDDGIGLPEQPTTKGSGLGSTIVAAMAQSVRASVELDRTHNGTRFIVSLTG
jgi:two-component sensor histidine kinase